MAGDKDIARLTSQLLKVQLESGVESESESGKKGPSVHKGPFQAREPFDIDKNLGSVIGRGLIKLSMVRLDMFREALKRWWDSEDRYKIDPYEAIHYSVQDNVVTLTRDAAKEYVHKDDDLIQGFDLEQNWNTYNYTPKSARPPGGTKLEALQQWEEKNQCFADYDFVTSRHSMVEIMNSIFNRERIKVVIAVFRGCLFLEAVSHDLKVDANTMCGYNFEALMTCESLESFESPKNNDSKYNSLVAHRYCDKRYSRSLLVSSEADACFSTDFDRLDDREVLKNNIEFKLWRKMHPKKTAKARIQCYLGGVGSLMVGRRNQNNQMESVESIDVEEKSNRKGPQSNRDFLDPWLAYLLNFIYGLCQRQCRQFHTHKKSIPKYFCLLSDGDYMNIRPLKAYDHSGDLILLEKYIKWANSMNSALHQ